MLRWILVVVAILTLTACGGSSSSDDSESVEESGQLFLVKPNYQGKRDVAEVPQNLASTLIYELLFNLDFLHSIAFFGEYSQFFLFGDNFEASQSNGSSVCSSGTRTTEEFEKDKLIVVTYDRCVSDGLEVNGTMQVQVFSVITADIPYSNIVPDLEFTPVGSDASLSLSGYIKVTDGDQDQEAKALLQVLLTNSEGEQIYFDDFLMASSFKNDTYGLSYNGSIYFSPLGKLDIVTLAHGGAQDLSVFLEVSGTHSIFVDVSRQKEMTITYDDTSLPLTTTLVALPDAIYQNVNQKPEAMITAIKTNVDRYTQLPLSAKQSSDPDLDVLSFQWRVIDAPSGANYDLPQEVETGFQTDLPGNYKIELRVSDGNGGTATDVIDLFVEQSEPDVELVAKDEQLEVHQLYQAQIHLLNDEFDGPIEMALAYGPEQMQLTPSGELSWQVDVPDFGEILEVNFGIYLSNQDKQVILPFSVSVYSAEDNEIASLSQKYNGTYGALKRVKKQFVSPLREAVVIHVEDGLKTEIIQYYLDQDSNLVGEWRHPVVPDSGDVQLIYDINGDGKLDEVINVKSTEGRELWLKDGINQTQTKVLSFHRSTNIVALDVVNYGSNKQALVVYHERDYSSPDIYSLPDFELLYETNSNDETIGLCDLLQDGTLVLVSETKAIYLPHDDPIIEFSGLHPDVHILLGENSCFLVESYEEQSYLHFLDNGKLRVREIEIGGYGLVGDFDSHPGQDLITAQPSSDDGGIPQWQMHKFDSEGNMTTRNLTLEQGVHLTKWNGNDYGLRIGVADIDGDDLDEIITTIVQENTPGFDVGLKALEVKDNQLQLDHFTNGVRLSGSETIVDLWPNNKLVIANEQRVTVLDETGVLNDWPHSGSLLKATVEDGQLVYYFRHYPSNQIAKYNTENQLLWTIEPNISTGGTNFSLGQGLVYFSTQQGGVFIDDSTGDLINGPYASNTNFSVSFLPEQNVFFDFGLQQLRKILDDNSIVNLVSNNSDGFGHKTEPVYDHEIEFLQYDDDPQLEILIYARDMGNHTLEIYDSVTLLAETLRPWHVGLLQRTSPVRYGDVENCPTAESVCRNQLVINNRFLYTRDKVSGKVIWESPDFKKKLRDAKVFKKNGKTKLAVSGYGVLYIFH